MKKSPHRHVDRRRLKHIRWKSKLAAWKIKHLAAIARIEAMPAACVLRDQWMDSIYWPSSPLLPYPKEKADAPLVETSS